MPTVLDTNMLASMAVSHPDSKLSFIGKCWMQKVFQVYISDHIITELERTLSKPYFSSRLPSDEAKAYINNVIKHSIKQEVTTVIDREKIDSVWLKYLNVEDDQVLATAVDANAEYLVTGDKELAKLWSFEGVLIIPPSDFVEILERYRN